MCQRLGYGLAIDGRALFKFYCYYWLGISISWFSAGIAALKWLFVIIRAAFGDFKTWQALSKGFLKIRSKFPLDVFLQMSGFFIYFLGTSNAVDIKGTIKNITACIAWNGSIKINTNKMCRIKNTVALQK